nr:EOG090X0FH3 [Chydorus sphaericus]
MTFEGIQLQGAHNIMEKFNFDADLTITPKSEKICSYRATVRNWIPAPIEIASQELPVQLVLGSTLALLSFFLATFVSTLSDIDYIFRYQEVNVKDVSGRLVIACYLLNSLICATSLWAIVQRTKLCLDFSATAHVLHLVASLIYNAAWPSSASWWVLQFSCATITCVLGEFLCLRSEMKSIPLGMSSRVDL